MLKWFHKLGSPRSFFEMTGVWLPWLAGMSMSLLAIGAVWALGYVPEDYQQGNSVRIMYIHVPAAMLAQSAYMAMAVASAVFLIWRIKMADIAASCIAPFGASITFLALVTGAIWGKPTWGTWWVWDARLTSTLVLFFLYAGAIALRAAMDNRPNAARACALLVLVGVVNLPIIKYSVDWWYTLHQSASFSLTEKPAMPIEMWAPLLFMVIAFYFTFATIAILRMRNEILVRERKSDWVRKWVMTQ